MLSSHTKVMDMRSFSVSKAPVLHGPAGNRPQIPFNNRRIGSADLGQAIAAKFGLPNSAKKAA